MPTKQPKNEPFVARVLIPIYEQVLFLSVADTVSQAVSQLPVRYFPGKDDVSTTGMNAGSVSDEVTNALAIVLSFRTIERECIAHEVRHTEGKLFSIIEQKPLPHESEVACYLNDWLTTWVYKQLDRRGLQAK